MSEIGPLMNKLKRARLSSTDSASNLKKYVDIFYKHFMDTIVNIFV